MKRLLPFLVAVALLLSSCGSSAPKETEAPKMTLDEVKANSIQRLRRRLAKSVNTQFRNSRT